MKSKFPGSYIYHKGEINVALENATLVVDAYLLLDLFRINQGSELLKIFEQSSICDRLWLPYDVAWLYHHSVNVTIKNQIENIKSTSAYYTAFMSSLQDVRNHPYVDDKLFQRVIAVGEEVLNALTKTDKFLTVQLRGYGPIKGRVEALFHGKVGDAYDPECYSQLYGEALVYHKQQRHPCVSCREDVNERIKWNNYIIWMQMQKFAEENNKDIVFITNRTDENWFDIWRDSILSTQSELVDDFMTTTNCHFTCVSAYYFAKCFGHVLDSKQLECLLRQLNSHAIIYPDTLKTSEGAIYG